MHTFAEASGLYSCIKDFGVTLTSYSDELGFVRVQKAGRQAGGEALGRSSEVRGEKDGKDTSLIPFLAPRTTKTGLFYLQKACIRNLLLEYSLLGDC